MNLGVMTALPSGTTDHECAHVKPSIQRREARRERAGPRRSVVTPYAYIGQRTPHCKINPALTDNKAPLWL